MNKGQRIIRTIRNYFEEARKQMPGVTDDMLYDEGSDEKIFYMNGNDGTDFDWGMNERCCEFFMFYKSTEMGFIKVYVNKDDTIDGYMYKEDYLYGDTPISLKETKLQEGDALYLAALLYKQADKKNLYDKPICEIDFDYKPSSWEIEYMNGDDDNDDVMDAEWYDNDEEYDEFYDDDYEE